MVGLFELFRIFLQIGAFTLGGGYAMLTMVESVVVEKKHYIEKDEFWDLIAIVQALPGVFAINTALYVGYKLRGKRGAFFSALGAGLPSFIAILLVAICFTEIKDNETVQRIFRGVRPCVVALILVPSINLIFKKGFKWQLIWIPIVAALLIWQLRVSPVLIVAVVILLSLLWTIWRSRNMSGESNELSETKNK